MAVLKVSSTRFTGLTADTKPLTYNSIAVPTNSTYFDTQLGLEYWFDGAAWNLKTENVVTEAITNKTIVAASNTITDTSAASGDFLKHDGTRFVRNVPRSLIHFPIVWNATTTTVTYMSPFVSALLTNATETNVDQIYDYAFTVTNFRLVVTVNAKTNNTLFSFRDDGADATGVSITVPATTTGEFAATGLSGAVAAGSKINWKVDGSLGGVNSIQATGFIEALVLLQ